MFCVTIQFSAFEVVSGPMFQGLWAINKKKHHSKHKNILSKTKCMQALEKNTPGGFEISSGDTIHILFMEKKVLIYFGKINFPTKKKILK